MCGIVGFTGPGHERIEPMLDALRHRGPDGTAHWHDRNFSLGHARLAILDPRPEGNQPFWNDDRTIAIVFNGEIFNFRELTKEEGFACRTGTDTEVLLKLYEREGIACVSRLRGMFAFAVLDLRSDTLLLARDPNGINPLYVRRDGPHIAFASEMRSLLRWKPERPAIDRTSLSRYLRLQYVPGPRTLCEGIESLPPGTILTWKDGKEDRRVLEPRDERAAFRSKRDFTEAFPSIMDDAVRAHLISDRPVGLYLSGGIDSSILLHHMAGHASKPIKTFTIRFDATEREGGKRFNTDADLAKLTAAHYGTDHHEMFLSAEEFRDTYRAVARSLDQPNANSVAVAQAMLAREAKKSVDVALSGTGGDELFGGYPRYRIARILQLLSPIPGPLRSALGRMLGHPPDVLSLKPGPALAERLLARPLDEGRSVVRGDWFDPDTVTTLFNERFDRVQTLDPLRACMEFDRRLWLVDEALRLSDATSMASGLECRVPFVDRAIIAAAHATPSRWHVGPRRTKALLKDAYRPLLPAHLYTLPKASFFPPMAKWLRRECAPLAEEMLEHPRLKEYFDMDAVRALYEAHRDHRGYHVHLLSSLIQLSHWFDTVYDA